MLLQIHLVPSLLRLMMASPASAGSFVCPLRHFLLFILQLLSFVVADRNTLDVTAAASLTFSPTFQVENAPGIRPGVPVYCERLQIQGFSKLKNLDKFAHSVKVKVVLTNASIHSTNSEVCFHRNLTLAIGMCPQGQWEKLSGGLWSHRMAPFDKMTLDLRVIGSSFKTFEVYVEEEFNMYRVIYLATGMILMTLALSLSRSLHFYYGSAMTLGIILFILIVLFQGMRLLPSGRKSSLLYSSFVGLGFVLFGYMRKALQYALVELGISEDMYEPLEIFFLCFIVIIGAWLGFWVVRNIILREDRTIDENISYYVAWLVWILGAFMILQGSMDTMLAAEVLICKIIVSLSLKRLSRIRKSSSKKQLDPDSPYANNGGFIRSRWNSDNTVSCHSQGWNAGEYYSTFHDTPQRRKFSSEEWEKFTQESTRKGLQELVSSPDFTKWAIAHADKITLSSSNPVHNRGRRWLPWF